MSDDIKARLRERVKLKFMCCGSTGCQIVPVDDLWDTLEHIEALEAENARLRAALERIDHNAGYTYDSCRTIARAALSQDKEQET